MAFVQFMKCIPPLDAVDDALGCVLCGEQLQRVERMKLIWIGWRERKIVLRRENGLD